MDAIYSILKREFGLRDKHILIIKNLEGRTMNVDEIIKNTTIPKGRIYECLNELVEMGIVEKKGKKPFLYTITDLKKNLLWFMKNRIDVLIRTQSEVVSGLGLERQESVELVDGALKFTQTHMKMLNEAKVLKVTCIHRSFPYLLYPENPDDFLTVRKIITHARPTITHIDPHITLLICRSYMDALKSGKKISVVFEKDSFDFHMGILRKWLGEQKFISTVQDTICKLKKYNVEANVVDDYNTMQVDANEKRVCLSINYVGVTNGILITSKEAVNFVNQIFDEKINRSQNCIPLLEGILKR